MITDEEVAEFELLVKQLCQDLPEGPGFLEVAKMMITYYNDDPTYTNASSIQNALTNTEIINLTEQQRYSKPLALLQGWVKREMEAATKEHLEGRLRENKFRTGSDLDEYEKAFGPAFNEHLGSLVGRSRWLDAGAGKAVAMRQYLEKGGQAKCLACSFEIPGDALQQVRAAEEKYGEQFRYLQGKYFGNVSDEEFGLREEGSFNLITDLNGVLYYTTTFLEDLKRYLDMLALNGKLCCTHLPGLYLTLSEHKDLSGRFGVRKWLAGITNVSLTVYTTLIGDAYVLTKTGEHNELPATEWKQCYTVEGQNATQTILSCHGPIIGDPTIIKLS